MCCISAKVVVFGSVSIRAELVVFGQRWLYSGKEDVFGLKWLFSGKLMYSVKVVIIGQKLLIFGQKWLYSGKISCIRAMRLYLGKLVVFGQK